MSATRYIIAASASFEAKQYSRKEDAIRNAAKRALTDAAQDIVVATQTGREVHRIPATVVPEPAAPARKGRGQGPREALELVELGTTTWEVLYRHPRVGTETWREQGAGKYAIVCTSHSHVERMTRLIDDRQLRREGRHTWCPGCAAAHAA